MDAIWEVVFTRDLYEFALRVMGSWEERGEMGTGRGGERGGTVRREGWRGMRLDRRQSGGGGWG